MQLTCTDVMDVYGAHCGIYHLLCFFSHSLSLCLDLLFYVKDRFFVNYFEWKCCNVCL